MRAPPLLVLAMLLLVAGSAGADAKDVVGRIREQLDDARCKEARKILEGKDRAVLLEDPAEVRTVCAQLADRADGIARDAADLEHAEDLFEAFETFGREAVEKHGENADVRRGLACVLLAKARYQTAMREVEGATLWKRASELCLEASRLEAKAEHVVAASRYMRDAATRLATPPVPEHLAAADRILADARARFPDATALVIEGSRVDLLRARVALAQGDKKRAKALARGILRQVETLTQKSTATGRSACAAWNKAVSFLLEHGLDKHVEHKTRAIKTRWRYLTLELPSGTHWSVRHSSGTARTMTTLSRWDDAGGRTRIFLMRYKWGTEYKNDDVPVGGDNVRGLMEQDRKTVLGWFPKILKHKKLIKGRLNRAIPKTTGFELRALDKDGDPWWFRCFFFKGEEHRRTFCVRVEQFRRARHGLEPGPDPEIELILRSIRELPKAEDD